MRKPKHTPGPWKHDKVFALIVGPKGEEVAAVHSGTTPERQNLETANYNVRLIAAAPEMLEALKRLTQMHFHCKSGEHICDACKLIAKAEGWS